MAVKSINYKGREFEISYEIINPKKEKDILFLHGWGSNKEIMKSAFGREFEEFRHIYIDYQVLENLQIVSFLTHR